MPIPDIRNRDLPVGPLRDRLVITIGTDDYVLEQGFICQVNTAGNITYRTIEGESDQAQTGLSAGDIINVAGIPVLLSAVRGTSTVTSIIVGRL